MEEQKDRFESTEPEDDDVEGHRLAKDDPEREADRNLAEPDVEAHRDMNREMNREANREANREMNRNKNVD